MGRVGETQRGLKGYVCEGDGDVCMHVRIP